MYLSAGQVRVHDELWAVGLDDGGGPLSAEHMREVRPHLRNQRALFKWLLRV